MADGFRDPAAKRLHFGANERFSSPDLGGPEPGYAVPKKGSKRLCQKSENQVTRLALRALALLAPGC